MIRRLALAFLLVASSTAAQEAQPSVQLPADLARVLRDYERAWGGKDAAALSRLFAEDGYVLPNGGAPVKGRAAIEQHYKGAGGPLFLRAFSYAAEGSVAYILGGYTGNEGAADTGSLR
jgi:ketosteroid isomerase-like protein